MTIVIVVSTTTIRAYVSNDRILVLTLRCMWYYLLSKTLDFLAIHYD